MLNGPYIIHSTGKNPMAETYKECRAKELHELPLFKTVCRNTDVLMFVSDLEHHEVEQSDMQ